MLALLAAALAADLPVTVLPDPDLPLAGYGRVRAAPTPLPRLGDEPVDGARGPAWDHVPATPLLAFADGPAPGPADVRWAWTDADLRLWVGALEPGWTTTLALDPDGAGTAWLELTVDAEVAAAARCAVPPADEARHPVSGGAVPCAPVDGVRAVRGPEGWEIAAPWAFLQPATWQLRALTRVTGPGGAGGTTAAHGARGAAPAVGATLDRDAPRVRPSLVVEPDGRWALSLAHPEAGPRRWTWTRYQAGTEVDRGQLDTREAATVSLPAPADALPGVVVLRQERAGALAPGFVLHPRPLPSLRVRTPVVDEVAVLSWSTRAPADLTLVVREDGVERGRATVALPAGDGLLRLGLPPGDRLTVEASPGLSPTPIVRRR